MMDLSPDELERYKQKANEVIGIGENKKEKVEELMSVSMDTEMDGEKVKNIVLRNATEVRVPSYLIDLSEAELAETTLKAIRGLLPGGNTAVYIKGASGEHIFVGEGDDYVLYTVLEGMLETIFENKHKLYKNNGDGFKKINKMDVSSVRLNL